jgi:DNA adenine methylase
MSTPCGPHKPIAPESFAKRVHDWSARVAGASFITADFEEAFRRAKKGDLIYCDPPYVDSQKILYGAQTFSLTRLYEVIRLATLRGVRVALSIDGSKKSGAHVCDISVPDDLFVREVIVDVGRSMLKRFQRGGGDVADERVTDRLLLNY